MTLDKLLLLFIIAYASFSVITAISTPLSSSLSLSASSSFSSSRIKINPTTHEFVDEFNRVRIFHGFNAVEKGFPWYPLNLLNHTQLDLYQQWGFNAVRLGYMWSGVQPQENEYNTTYNDIIMNIINQLNQRDMYALLDMHQDGFSSLYGLYDGIPIWLANRSSSAHPYPWPFSTPPTSSWALNYLTQACSVAFQDLYNNNYGMRDQFISFWEQAANLFKDVSGVLGYELINEPWAGDIYSDPLLFLPGLAGSKNLEPLYDTVATAIRKIDNSTLIFYEPVTWGMVLNNELLGNGFTHVPGGDLYKDRSVLSYHYYCWFINNIPNSAPYPTLDRWACDSLLGPQVFSNVIQQVQSTTGGGLMLTEFGLCATDKNRSDVGSIECEAVLELADTHMASWTYWDSGFFDSNGNINLPVVQGFARVYPRAIAGQPISYSFNTTTTAFRFNFIIDTTISAPTEIVVPTIQYPNGYHIETSNNLKWIIDSVENYIVLVSPITDEIHSENSQGQVVITPK